MKLILIKVTTKYEGTNLGRKLKEIEVSYKTMNESVIYSKKIENGPYCHREISKQMASKIASCLGDFSYFNETEDEQGNTMYIFQGEK